MHLQVSGVGGQDREIQGDSRNQKSRRSLAPERGVCASQNAPSDLSSKTAGKRLKAFWVQWRDGGKEVKEGMRDDAYKNESQEE